MKEKIRKCYVQILLDSIRIRLRRGPCRFRGEQAAEEGPVEEVLAVRAVPPLRREQRAVGRRWIRGGVAVELELVGREQARLDPGRRADGDAPRQVEDHLCWH